MTKILGLDLGTNSIGWALVDKENKKILGIGSRIIPMGTDKSDYEKGVGITKNADRRLARDIRKMNKRFKMRRNKLLFILNELGCLPDQFQFKNGVPESNKLQDMELLPIKKHTLQLDSFQQIQLNVKALNDKVELKELGKILYRFNQLRGYSGGGTEDDDTKNQKEIAEDDENNSKKTYEIVVEKVELTSVEKSEDKFKTKNEELNYYNVSIIYQDEEIEGRSRLQNLSVGEQELEIRIKRNKKGQESYEFALPRKTNWRKQMEATEDIIKTENVFVCELLLRDLQQNKWNRIRNRVILRNRYKDEFDAIWDKQYEKNQEFKKLVDDKELLEKIIRYIFPERDQNKPETEESKKSQKEKLKEDARKSGLKYLIKEQIIYYQRPLKSQTDLISKCRFEKEEQVLATSHPLFQEFRCWDQINRLYLTSKDKIFNEKKKKYQYKYLDRFLTNEQKQDIYNKLQKQKQVGFNDVAKIVQLKNDGTEYLNGLNPKAKLKGIDTTLSIKKILDEYFDELKQKDEKIVTNLWDILYNKTGNEYDENSEKVASLIKVLSCHLTKESATSLSLKLAQNSKFPRRYSNLSEKAVNNILPLMQLNPTDLPEKILINIANMQHLIETGEILDDNFLEDYVISFVKNNPNLAQTGGLMYAFAASLVYGTHTQQEIKKEITDYHQIKYNPNRNLRNPVVEQLSNEAMQVIKAIWKKYNLDPNELEIRVELARDLKNSAIEREKIYKAQLRGQKTNEAVKKRLEEQEILTTEENILKYKLWEQQKSMSPYSGQTLQIGLFHEYEIDHIIPKSRLFDDSFANKALVESYLNKEKDNRTAWEYLTQQNSRYKLQSLAAYLQHVNENYFGRKKKNLLLEKIPTDFVERQKKDTQYIAIAVKNELAKIVGLQNVKTSTGEITAFLRSTWGLRKLLMRLTEARFKQMELWDWNKETGQPSNSWITRHFDKEKQKHIYEIKNWSKRYDHRHHAVDALVVALTEQWHIQRLNNLNKELQNWLEQNKEKVNLIVNEDETVLEAFFNLDEKRREEIQKKIEGFRKIEAPFEDLVQQAELLLETMVVSHKPKDKLTIKTDEKTGKKQLKIRAALHEATFYGKWKGMDTKTLNISELSAKDIDKIIDQDVLAKEIGIHRKKYTSMKEAFTGEGLKAFNENRFQRKNPDKLKPPVYKVKVRYNANENAESGLQRLYEHNEKLSVVTGDNYMFLIMEKEGRKGKERVFDIASLYDSADIAKRAIKENEINFKAIVAEDFRIKHKDKPTRVLFTLQQNDLVYLPENEDDPVVKYDNNELKEWLSIDNNKKLLSKRVYKVVKFTGSDCFFVPHNYASPISVAKDLSDKEKEALKEKYSDKKIPKQELNYQEFGSFGTSTKTEVNENFVKELVLKKGFEGEKPKKIQDSCIKLQSDWLGNVVKSNP